MYSRCEEVLLKAAKGEDYEDELAQVCEFYGSDFDAFTLSTQLQTLSAQFCVSTSRDSLLLADIVAFFRGLTTAECALMSQVATLLKLVLVMPATNAVSERSFSAMGRIKNLSSILYE